MIAPPMAPFVFLLLAAFSGHLFAQPDKPAKPTSRVTVVGVVYCDTCFTNTFSKHSYFLPGADVQIQCTFKASAPETKEQISFSVNRTTNKYGTYKLDVPEVDGVDCVDGSTIESQCEATLIRSTYLGCRTPGLKTTTTEVSAKSKQQNLCIYSLNALSFRPPKKNSSLCGSYKQELLFQSSFNSSKFFLPFPPYTFPWPPLPQLPPLPPLPPLPQLPPFPPIPFPPLPPFLHLPPFPFPGSPPFPFPLPPIPPLFQAPPPPPPAFNPLDPRTWFPHWPLPPPAPPAFNLGDPTTWVPHFPPSSALGSHPDQKTP